MIEFEEVMQIRKLNLEGNQVINWLLFLSLTSTLFFEGVTFVEFSYFYSLIAVINFILSLNSLFLGAMAFFELLVVIQLLLAPAIQYDFFQGSDVSNLFNINMMVSEQDYFSFVASAIVLMRCFLFAGANRLASPFRINFGENHVERFSLFVIGTGLFGSLIFAVLPVNSLSFARVLATNLIPTGLWFLHFTHVQRGTSKNPFLSRPGVVFLLWFVISALGNAMFGQLLMWLLLFVLGSLEARPQSLARRIFFSFFGFTLVVALQLAKQNYRSDLNRGSEAGLSTFYGAFIQGAQNITDDSSVRFFQVNAHMRMNQGRILSHVMEKCESESIRENGHRLLTNILASIVPRFLWENKPRSGGQDNIEKFTRINLNSSTSMNISPLGDFYIDFGPFWGVIFTGFFGLIIRGLLRFLVHRCENDNRWLPFVPFMLSGVLVIETDFLSVLNFTIKSIVFLSICLWGHRVLGGSKFTGG